ncbi:solute carrier family 26 member 6-like protein [Labeo rohita]|uniref:Solute carrier family 26 member 6-like protein n=1 Tax=Labeo rohita TaxID=84645 RepID=A0A498NVQ4_LABRO|nr:solute carrier family 26 member 6-like protein [Labeo rohita]RXN36260.1 solute carrier family 26 member 6-like protein [Labeo rohita]
MGVSDNGAKFCVERIILDEPKLEEVAQRQTEIQQFSIKEKISDSVRCSVGQWKVWILTWIPLLSWIPKYSVRENGLGDLVSGISVGIMHLPQGMAYGLLASVPPVFGLYTSFYPVLVYFIFGTSRHVSIGTFAVISIMIGSVSERLAPDDHFLTNGTNGSFVVDTEARDVERVKVAAATTLLCGIFQVLLGLVRFGFVVTYFSEPLVRGYTTGAATHVITSQLKYMFGVSPKRFSGPLQLLYTLVELGGLLPQTHIPTLVITLVSLTALIIVKEINSCYSHKLPLPIPIELLVIIAGTLVSHFIDLRAVNGVDVVGKIPSGLVPPRVPEVGFFSSVIGDAFAVAVVGYAISISLGKTFALRHGYKVDSNQELVALGLSNAIGGFFQCYSVTSSLSRSLVQESTGGKTQMAGMVSAVIVLITVLKLGPLFEELPTAVLSTIVFVNLKGMFMQFQDIPALWKSNRVDLLVWVVTFLCTVLLNLDLGLAVSIVFTLLTVIFRTQRPRYSLLGRVSDTELYLETESYKEAKAIPGVIIFRSSAMIYYANAELYREALLNKSGINVQKLLKQKKRKEEEENAKKKHMREQDIQAGVLRELANRMMVSIHHHGMDKECIISDSGIATITQGNMNCSFQPEQDSEEKKWYRQTDAHSSSCNRVRERTHSIILDLSPVSFIDTVTLKTLKNEELKSLQEKLKRREKFKEECVKTLKHIQSHQCKLSAGQISVSPTQAVQHSIMDRREKTTF